MYEKFFKRVFDIILTLIFIPVWLPLICIIGAIVKLTSSGPAFFCQYRGARGDTEFKMYKFRSMRVDQNAERKGFEPGQKSRITTIGRILRKSKFDELPQLINVLRGDMSLVGPRPEVPVYLALYPERWSKVRVVRPGITDPASLKFRNEEQILSSAKDPEKEYKENVLPHKLDLYEEYVRRISLSGDLRIIFQTLWSVVSR